MNSLASSILNALKEQPRQFSELVDLHRDSSWREFLRAWGQVRGAAVLARDENGRYLLKTDAKG